MHVMKQWTKHPGLRFAGVSQRALLWSGVLVGMWPPLAAKAAERPAGTPSPVCRGAQHAARLHHCSSVKAATPAAMATPSKKAPQPRLPAAPQKPADAGGAQESIMVLGTVPSYTAPTVEAWGKSPVVLKDVPQSITILTQERMQDSNMLTMTDAMSQINGIRVFPGSTANSNFYSRGYQLTTSVDGTPKRLSQK
jgi:outer membrane receptor for ferric coprogen and ferric-rhodotorulic acid